MNSPTFVINLLSFFEKEHGKTHDKYIHSQKVYNALIHEINKINTFILTNNFTLKWTSNKYGNVILIGINSGTFMYIIDTIEIEVLKSIYIINCKIQKIL